MQQYLDLLRLVLDKGKFKADRTGTGTYSLFGAQTRFDLRAGFPLLTTKSCTRSPSFTNCSGSCAARRTSSYLKEHGVTIWDEWADKDQPATSAASMARNGATGAPPTAAPSTRSINVIAQIKANPDSRRLIVSAWNPGEIDQAMALPPCHTLFQFYVSDGELSCQLYQRSADIFLGVPFNIASYALLTLMVAQVCGLQPGDFVHTFGDLHLYANHLEQTKLQLAREPRPLPTMKLNPAVKNIHDFKFEDFTLEGYDPASRHQGTDCGVAIWSLGRRGK